MAEIEHLFLVDSDDLLTALAAIRDESKDAEQGVKEMGETSDKSFKEMANGGKIAAAGVVIAAAAVALLTKETLDLSKVANQFAKDARAFGTSAEEIQKLQGSFNLLTDGSVDAVKVMAKLAKGTAEAAAGTKNYSDAFGLLGIEAEEFAELDPTEQFKAMTKGLNELESATERDLVGTRLLGKSYRALKPALDAGVEGFEEAAASITDAGFVSNETAAAAEELEDAIELLSRGVLHLKSEVLTPLIPIIEKAAEGLSTFLKVADDEGVIDDLSASLGRLAISITKANSEATDLGSKIGGTAFLFEVFIDAVTLTLEGVKLLETAFGDILESVNVFANGLGQVLGGLKSLRELAGEMGVVFEDSRNGIGGFTDAFDELITSGTEVNELLELTIANQKLLEEGATSPGFGGFSLLGPVPETKKKPKDKDGKSRKKEIDEEAEALAALEKLNEMVIAQLEEMAQVQADVAFAAMDADAQIMASAEARIEGLEAATVQLTEGLEDDNEQRIALEQELADTIVAINTEKDAKLKALSDARFAQQQDGLEQLREDAAAAASKVNAQVQEAADAFAASSIDAIQSFLGSTQSLTDIATTAILSSQDELTQGQKEAVLVLFGINKAAALAEGVVNTALAVSNALGAATPPLNFILAAAAGVAGGIALAAIAAAPPPTFHKGTSNALEFGATLERGEGVVNRGGMSQPGAIDMVNDMNRGAGGGGVNFNVFRVGNRTTEAQLTENLNTRQGTLSDAIRSVQPRQLGRAVPSSFGVV